MTGQHLLLLLWTLWLVLALLYIGRRLWPGVILVAFFAAGLTLVMIGLVKWRWYLIAWLAVHLVVVSWRAWRRSRVSVRDKSPQVTSASLLGRRLQTLSAWMWRNPRPLFSASVSFAGLIWLLILQPTVPWMYRADIPIMIATIIALVAVEYECWVLFNIDRRIERLDKRLRPKATNTPSQPLPLSAPVPEPEASDEDDSLVWYHPSDTVGSWAESDELASGGVRVELLRIARLTARQEGSNATAGRVVGITLERRTVAVSPGPDETVSRVITKAVEMLSHEIETCAAAPGPAQAISPSNWEVVSARWVQAGSAGVSTGGRTVDDLGASLNSILHHEPVQRVFSWNAPGSAAAVIGKDAETKKILNFAGIVVGTRSGQAAAISACVMSLARDDFTRSLAAGIARTLGLLGLSGAPAPPNTHRLAG